jgi:spermidine synthase
VKPFRTLGQTRTPDGSQFALLEHDGDYFLKLNGRQLMSTTSTSSELVLAEVVCERLARQSHPRVLIGGLGLGFSLQRALELISRGGTVEVAELLPEVVAWNREFLRSVNGRLLDDPRVKVLIGDVFEIIRQTREPSYDAILLDVDNGPTSFIQPKNSRLYDRHGFNLIKRSLRPGGQVAFWSATDEPAFVVALSRSGFKVKTVEAKSHERAKRFAHRIYVAEIKPQPAPAITSSPPRDRKAGPRDSVS